MNISDFYNQFNAKVTTPKAKPQVSSTPLFTPRYALNDRGIELSDKDFDAFRPLLYGEISNRTPDKQELESQVILNTALNRVKEYKTRGQKKTLADVVAMPNQYQAYNGPQYKNYYNPPDDLSIAKKKQVDLMVDKIKEQIRKGEFVDNTGGAYYYVHEPDGKIRYDNVKPLFAK